MFRCSTEQKCIHVGNVCDGNIDCPLRDDELFCELMSIKCPLASACLCLLFAVWCENIKLGLIYHNFAHIYVAILNSKVMSVNSVMTSFDRAILLRLTNNSIIDICQLQFPHNLQQLEVGKNSLKALKRNCFSSLALLAVLGVNDNCISKVESKSLCNLPHLQFLNISNNPISLFHNYFLENSSDLRAIFLENNSIAELHSNTFQNARVDVILTDDYRVCCIAPSQSKCTADPAWHKSCTDILPRTEMKVFYMTVSLLILLLNGLSVLVNTLAQQLNKSFLITLVCMNTSEILVLVFLGVVWTADQIWKGIFPLKEVIWRSGSGCSIAFATVLWYSVSAECLLLLFSLSRLMVVVYPIDTEFKRVGFVTKFLVSILVL